ncbi:MAG: type IV pilus biogenesis/stability protein PilW [Gammaproteobacteria bacterium]|nr:type IV pilus biogenesis/stability protein PilW [Gammaproteobacteria bacterium]
MHIRKLFWLLAAIALIQGCVAVNPQPSKDEKASAINVQLGIGYLRQNNLDLASEKLTKALRQNSNSAAAHNAYAILQERLLQLDKAEYHYERATSLDPENAQAANNYGAFLCRNGRELESEKYFLRALDNPLYNTPEYAYTNAAVCLLRVKQTKVAKDYLRKAIASKNDFGPALLALGNILFEEADYRRAKPFLDHYHLVAQPSARSLWLAIRNTLELDSGGDVDELARRLEREFPDSEEYKSWLKIQ